MGSSRLSDILKDINNSKIKVSELQCDEINSIDINFVKELARKLTIKFSFHFIIVFLASIFATYVLYDTIRTSTEKFNKEIIGFFFIALMFFWVLCYVLKQILSTINSTCKKAQYGIVKNKYSLKSSAKSSSPKKYYIDVLFPDTNAYIREVICTDKIYKSLEEGTSVLVISFDNKTAYAVPSDSK
ncbi:hypothetical protein [Clostridium sp. 'White wine YQ']|uniref:hypothetical protein n=1 Tax=Clostridium sp. 'White wine YQ' TaxID=3027474 RepID=UPI00236657F5|nr:hypothetical protein [Clostridium sp. 'White wine YQ']MDD7794506.1 hypothetical protein [Clostridium sp. 'White wine YQ']